MLFRRNFDAVENLLPKMLKGERAIALKIDEYDKSVFKFVIKDDSVIDDKVLEVFGVLSQKPSYISRIVGAFFDSHTNKSAFLSNLTSKQLVDLNICRFDREPWTSEDVSDWAKLVEMWLSEKSKSKDLYYFAQAQLNLLLGGYWQCIEDDNMYFFFDSRTVGDPGDNDVEMIVEEIFGNFVEFESYDHKHRVHIYESRWSDIYNLDDLKDVIYFSLDNPPDHIEIVLDREMADRIIEKNDWASSWFSGMFSADDLKETLMTAGYSDAEVWIIIAALVKNGVDIIA